MPVGLFCRAFLSLLWSPVNRVTFMVNTKSVGNRDRKKCDIFANRDILVTNLDFERFEN